MPGIEKYKAVYCYFYYHFAYIWIFAFLAYLYKVDNSHIQYDMDLKAY